MKKSANCANYPESIRVHSRTLLLFLFFQLFAPFLSAQTAAELERLLDAKETTYGDAAYFTLASALENPPDRPQAAFALARENGWLPDNAAPEASVTLRDLSLLMIEAFGLEGGLLYRVIPGPRYAYREMTRRGFIEGRAYPGFTVSGEKFLQILGNVLSRTGDDPPPAPASGEAVAFEETETNIVIEDTARGRTVRLLNAVYFEADSAVLIKGSRSVLDELGALLASRPDATVTLRAYTAPYGTREGRLAVSRNRAGFCRDYLQKTYRVESGRIQIELYGADQLPEWGRGPDGSFVAVESFRCVEFILHE
ncbi:MAG: OmpA family protein [Treponema sp.]|jgi:flagellar motor protein MotB|nr:OmpA family protein [Treponema sp.]